MILSQFDIPQAEKLKGMLTQIVYNSVFYHYSEQPTVSSGVTKYQGSRFSIRLLKNKID